MPRARLQLVLRPFARMTPRPRTAPLGLSAGPVSPPSSPPSLFGMMLATAIVLLVDVSLLAGVLARTPMHGLGASVGSKEPETAAMIRATSLPRDVSHRMRSVSLETPFPSLVRPGAAILFADACTRIARSTSPRRSCGSTAGVTPLRPARLRVVSLCSGLAIPSTASRACT